MKLSVVIPTLNEEAYLAATIGALRARTAGEPVEVIVADCGSVDTTVEAARQCGTRVATCASGANRSQAYNAGALLTTGNTLLFLHADSFVPAGFDGLIGQALTSPAVVGGAFEFALDGPERRLRLVELVNRLRYRVRGRFFGDQGIFVRRDVFEQMGGFPRMDILEDAHFCAEARKLGTMRLLSAPMVTSPRRFYRGGILRTLGLDIAILLADLLHLNTERLAVRYRRDNLSRGLETLAHEVPSAFATRHEKVTDHEGSLGDMADVV